MTTTSFRQYDDATDALNFPYEYNNKETASLNKAANSNAQIDIHLLRRIALWKLDRVLDVQSETIKKLQSVATDPDLRVDSAETRSLIEELLECQGIGLPMASTILKFLRPDVFPIIDVRAWRAMYGKKGYFNQASVKQNIDHYLTYASRVRSIAEQTNRPLREIDEQLYCFDIKYNGTI